MSVELFDWDIQDSLDTLEARQAYFQAALEEYPDDPAFIQSVLGDIAKSYGVSKLAKEIGLSREGLYKSLNEDGNPSFATVFKVAKALGLDLNFGTPKVQPVLDETGIAQAALPQQLATEDGFDYLAVKHTTHTGKAVLTSLASSLWGELPSVKVTSSDYVDRVDIARDYFYDNGLVPNLQRTVVALTNNSAHKNAKHRAIKLFFSSNTKEELIDMLTDLVIESNKVPQTSVSNMSLAINEYMRFKKKEIPSEFGFGILAQAIK